MNESSETNLPEQLRDLEQQMRSLGQRMERVEHRLQIESKAEPRLKPVESKPPYLASSSPFSQGAPSLSLPIFPRAHPDPKEPPAIESAREPLTPGLPMPPASLQLLSSQAGEAKLPLPALPHGTPPRATTPGVRAEEKVTEPAKPAVPTPFGDASSSRKTPDVPQAKPPVASPPLDWENLIGGKWALWMGSFSLFLAVALFLAYTWRHLPPAPPWARVAMGLGGGFALLVVGGYARPRTQRWFSEGLSGAGLAICYLSLWTSVQLFHLLPFAVAFGAMAGLTALGVYLAVRYDALSLSVLSTLGGFLTPVLLHSGSGPGSLALALPLLTYIALLNAGILGVSLFKRWRFLTWLSFGATLILLAGWAQNTNLPAMRWPVFAFFTLYFLLFLGAACFYSLARREPTADEDLVLLFAASSFYALSSYALVAPILGAFSGTFPLGLALFYALVGIVVRILAPGNISLRYSIGGLALLALTITVPMQLQQPWIAVGWTVEAGILLLLSRRLQSVLLQRAGQVVWLLSLWPIAFSLFENATPHLLLLNARALPLLCATLMAAIVALDAHFAASRASLDETAQAAAWRDDLSPLYASFSVQGGAWLIAQETVLGFSWHHFPTTKSWQIGALFAVSALWAVYALAVFSLSLRWRHQIMRVNALMVALLAAALPVWAGSSGQTPDWTPFWNLRVLAFAVVTVVWLLLGRLIAHENETLNSSTLTPAETETFGIWPIIASLLALVGATFEVYFGFEHWHPAGDAHWQPAASFALTMLWSSYAGLLIWLSSAWRQSQLRVMAYLVGSCAVGVLLLDSILSEAGTSPIFNLRLAAFAVASGVAVGLARWLPGQSEAMPEWENKVSGACVQTAALLVLWGLTQEIYESCSFYRDALHGHWRVTAFFGIAMLWSGVAALLIRLSFAKAQPKLRPLAYLTGACSIALLLTTALAFELPTNPVLNVRFATFAWIALAIAAAARWLRAFRPGLPEEERGLASGLFLISALVLLWGVSQEIYESCRFYQNMLPANWRAVAWFANAILWQASAFALLIIGLQRDKSALRQAAYRLGGAAGALLLCNALNATRLDWTPFLNVRWIGFFVTASFWGGAALQLNRWRIMQQGAQERDDESALIRPLGLLTVALLGWGLTQETFETCYFLRAALGPQWDRGAQMAISLVWSLYGALLLIGGIQRSYQPVRVLALSLLCATVVKVFVFDLSFLDGGLRVLSLGGLGVSLIFISWLYSRFGAIPRESRENTAAPPQNSSTSAF